MKIDDLRTQVGLKVRRIFYQVIEIVFAVILLLITLAIVAGVLQLFYNLTLLLVHPAAAGRYQAMITDILTLFIMIELSRSLVEYFNTHRLRLTFIADAAIVFVLREVMIHLFEHRLPITDIYAYSALLFVLSALRTAAVLVYHQERRLQYELGELPGAAGAAAPPRSRERGGTAVAAQEE